MNNRMAWLALAVALAVCTAASAQSKDADIQKVLDHYQAAFNNADSKAIGALYTADAIRVGPDGQLLSGRAAIEQSYAEGFAGPLKGSTLTIQSGRIQMVTSDVKLSEGRFSAGGSGSPTTGRYVNTLVRQGGQWLLASVVTIPDTASGR
jgi:uncharacterized protein (TIGR02246 family)